MNELELPFPCTLLELKSASRDGSDDARDLERNGWRINAACICSRTPINQDKCVSPAMISSIETINF